MAGRRAQTLLEMMHFIERFTLNRAWNGLMDDELLWEPMPGCWTVRPVEQSLTTAEEAVGTMRAGWRELGAALRSASDEQLEQPVRFWSYGGPGPKGTGAQVVALMLNEVSHHGTQIGVLRDLYRLRAGASIECHAE